MAGRAASKAPAGQAEIDPALLERPKLGPDVVVHEPTAPDAPWIVQRGPHKYIRVEADMARLLQALDGTRDAAELAGALGPPWTAGLVENAVKRLVPLALIDDGRKRRGNTWFKFVPPLTFQFTLLKPERLLRRLSPAIRALSTRAAAAAGVAVAVGGLLSLAGQASHLNRALGEPLPLGVLFAVTIGSLVTTALHEMGHGAVLTHYGGRPSRMGFMLFYLMPAFFCDVSDGWRLPDRQQRVRVALAGIGTQVVIASAVALGAAAAAAAGASTATRDGMLLFAASTYVAALFNLVPLVKLDGYIALMARLDLPHLRDRAMADAWRSVTKAVLGGRGYNRELPDLRWAVPYGLACIVFPLYLVGLAVNLWLDIFHGLGVATAVLLLAGLVYLLYRVVKRCAKAAHDARAAGAGPGRVVAGALLSVAALAALSTVPLPYSVTGGFVHDGDRSALVLSGAADVDAVVEGAEVALGTRGVVLRNELGEGVVADGGPRESTAPMSAFLPVRETEAVPVLVVELPLTVTDDPGLTHGFARVDAGQRPLWQWLHLNFIAPALRG